MFMRHNRAVNGAPQPEETARADAPRQRRARKLQPNEAVPPGADWRFTPDMSSCAAINDRHYNSGVSGNLYSTSYEASIPFVGDSEFDKSEKLKKR